MKIMTALTLVISLLFSVPAVTGAEAADDSFFVKAWEKAMPKLEKSLQLFDRQKELPESSFFGEDRKSNTKKYDELLDEVFEILIGSELH
ncbi:MAG: hypothetical protein EOM17_11660, partial [Synergistales bacterium]|nr:hypothetical protein [Synergistales bacterium]